MTQKQAELNPETWLVARRGLEQILTAVLLSWIPLVGVGSLYFAVQGYKILAHRGPTLTTRRAATALLVTVPATFVFIAVTVALDHGGHGWIPTIYVTLGVIQVARLASWVLLARSLCSWATSARLVADWDRAIRILLVALPIAGAAFALDALTDLWALKLPLLLVGWWVTYEIAFMSWRTYRLFKADLIPVATAFADHREF